MVFEQGGGSGAKPILCHAFRRMSNSKTQMREQANSWFRTVGESPSRE